MESNGKKPEFAERAKNVTNYDAIMIMSLKSIKSINRKDKF